MIITFNYGHKRIKYKNGLFLSIFNGFGSYSENHFKHNMMNKKVIMSKDCEIAVLKDNEFFTRDVLGVDSDVLGHIDASLLREIKKKVKNYDKLRSSKEHNND